MHSVTQTRRAELVQLTEAAVAVALSVLLGNLRLLELPNGGSIALATLPLLAFGRARGVRAGIRAGACAGIAHALSGGTIIHPVQLGLDYLVAYAALGLAGVGSAPAARAGSRASMVPGILLAMMLHLAAMVTSGVVFFSTVAGDAALAYSLAYNAATVVPETLLALWLTPPLVRALARANPADAWRRGQLAPPRLTRLEPRRVRRLTPVVSVAVARPAPVDPTVTPSFASPSRPAFSRPAPFAPRASMSARHQR